MQPSIQTCPVCASDMLLRTARRGKNAGGQFWGCSNYPKCKGIVAFDSDDGKLNNDATQSTEKLQSDNGRTEPVYWRDSMPKGPYYREYVSIGSMPGFASDQPALRSKSTRRTISQTLLLTKRQSLIEVSEEQKILSSVIQKILTRGVLPLSTLRVEEALINLAGISGNVQKFDERNSELGWKWIGKYPLGLSKEITHASAYRSLLSESDIETLSNDILSDVLDGDNERYFFSKWLTQTFGNNVLHWISPQAELDLILASAGIEQSGQRKIDFLFCHPMIGTIAIELDGEDHHAKENSDDARNSQLAEAGIITFRIPNSELKFGEGTNLSSLENFLRTRLVVPSDEFLVSGIPYAINAACVAARFQFILARALGSGQLTLNNPTWSISVRSDHISSKIFQAAADDFADMLSALASLHFGSSKKILINCLNAGLTDEPVNLSIAAFVAESPISISVREINEDYVLCPACAPVEFATDAQKIAKKTPIGNKDRGLSEKALLFFLQNLFRKRAFRELQVEAIQNALSGHDTVTLLPTGAGKSIIYQLAGLLQSGITLVVDPIVALIEDQILGLARVGIDKAGAAPSGFSKTLERQRWLRAVERGDFQFVLLSPERLQMGDTREALRALAEVTFINLAVIDEAHCVSEWGHNFRFSYLNLAENLRNYCKDINGESPNLLALTGTASRSVLREILTELNIDKNNSDALIRPLNFDRPELKFHITKTNSGGDSASLLRGILNGLPAKFNVPSGEFFQPNGSETNSGIVFTPFVNGRTHGLFTIKSAIQSSVNVPVTIYSGSAPKGIKSYGWDAEKRANAQQFKDNNAPILVATKAFGMGIDKPNIRWTVHMGVPSSMEAFYQEAGRAGRDKNLAYCSLIFSEVDPDATDKALASQGSLEELRQSAQSFNNNNDDISRALFFHLNAYSGIDEEIDEITRVLELIGDLNERKNIEVPFQKDTKTSLERAILRLIKTGTVEDLEVNFGSGYFLLKVPKFDFERARKKIEQYINDAQPARLKPIVKKLDQIANLEEGVKALELSRLMVEFTYDVIERSRRRMLYESVILGRKYSQDAEIRQYLLDYLQEGLGAEQIASLAEQPDIDFNDWLELFEKVSTPLDAGEMRGIIIRLLETFPDHPGMLAARGISEALVANPDQSLIRDSLSASLDSSKNRYSQSDEKILNFVENLLVLANTKSTSLRVPLIVTIENTLTIDKKNKENVWTQIINYSRDWDQTSKLCISAIEADALINNTTSGVLASIEHFKEIQQKLTRGGHV